MIRDTAIARTAGEPSTMTSLTITPETWMEDAACQEVPGDLFFPETAQGSRVPANVRALCNTCPVSAACAEFALRTNQKHGIWGGMSARTLRALRNAS